MLPISFLSLLILSCQTAEYSTSAYQMTSLNQRIGGDKSLAQPGDFMMENSHVRFSIIGNRASMGPHTFGGGVIDADAGENWCSVVNGLGIGSGSGGSFGIGCGGRTNHIVTGVYIVGCQVDAASRCEDD